MKATEQYFPVVRYLQYYYNTVSTCIQVKGLEVLSSDTACYAVQGGSNSSLWVIS